MKYIVISFCVMLLAASSLAEVLSQSATPIRRPLSRAANRSIVSGTATTNGVTWSYSVVNGAVVLGYFGFQRSAAVPQDTEGALIIPDVLDGKPVRDIRHAAFHNCTNLTSVTIPSSVTNIGEGAFIGCKSLKEFVVADGNVAYSSKDGVLFDAERTRLIRCPAAKNSEYVIPTGVVAVDTDAFNGCCLLTSVTIPSSAADIGEGAFYDCRSLKEFVIADGNPRYSSIDGVLFDTKRRVLLCCRIGKSGKYVIPSSVTSVGEYAFAGCRSLASVTIPPSVTNIDEGAFSDCSSLTAVTIPPGVTEIKAWTFDSCTNLTSVTIPSSVKNIEWYAFADCRGLTSVTIPPSVTNIGVWAFSDCSSLTSVTIPPGVMHIGSYAFSGCSLLSSVTITSGETSIGRDAFSHCRGLTSVTISDGVSKINARSFASCTNLTSVTIPSSVTSIGGGAFSGCSGLTSVTIPSSVTSIGEDAFSGCRGLTSVTIPSSVTNIGSCAFESCTNLTSVIIPPSVVRIGSLSFAHCEALSSVTIPSNAKEVNREAFRRCLKLKSVNVVKDGKIEVVALKDFLDQKAPVAKTSGLKGRSGSLVRRPALRNMQSGSSGKEEGLLGSRRQSQLTTSNRSLSRPIVNRPIARGTATTNGVTWSYSVVNGAVVLGNVGLPRRSSAVPQDTAGALIIPDVLDGKPVRDIRPGAFHYCTNLTSVTIPSTVTNIDCRAFDDCTNLKFVDVVSDGKVERMPVADFLKRYARLSSSNGSGMTDGIGGPSRSAGHRPGSLLSRRSQHQRTVEQDSARRAAARPDVGSGRDESNASKHELEDERAEQRRQLQAIQEELKRARQVRDAADRK